METILRSNDHPTYSQGRRSFPGNGKSYPSNCGFRAQIKIRVVCHARVVDPGPVVFLRRHAKYSLGKLRLQALHVHTLEACRLDR